MTHWTHRTVTALPAIALLAAIGCQGILGIDDPLRRDDAEAGAGGTPGSGGTDASGGSSGSSGSGGVGPASGGAGQTGGAGGTAGSGGAVPGTGGEPGSGGAGGDGGVEGGVPDGFVTINEVESSGSAKDWVELYNSGTVAVDLSGYLFADGSGDNAYTLPAGTVIDPGAFLVLEETTDFDFGLGSDDAARLLRPDGTTVISSYSWTNHALATYGACPDGSRELVPNATATRGTKNDCNPYVLINEVESSGDPSGFDWVELYNATLLPADISGWIFRDADPAHQYVIPQGTVVPPGRVYVLEEEDFDFGLGAPDSARLFLADGTSLVDSYAWTTHAATTYGRCAPSGNFTTTASPTKGAPNACTDQPTLGVWPGPTSTRTVDTSGALGNNLSGLEYEAGATAADDVLWAVRNAPSTLHRLKFDGTIWTPDTTGGWGSGKALRYPNGGGDPDAEGVTLADLAQPDLYVAAERDNDDGSESRCSVLRYVPTSASTFLVASDEWNLTQDLLSSEANRGLEGIAWLPDAYLTSKGFHDERLSKAYVPADYPDHGTGLFVVALEANGTLYVYALNHANGTSQRVASFASRQPNVNDLAFDRDVGYLWSYCGASCTNVATVFDIDVAVGSTTRGRFVVRQAFQAPSSLGSFTNEGITFAPESRCTLGNKPFFWSDDESMNGNSLHAGAIKCGAFLP